MNRKCRRSVKTGQYLKASWLLASHLQRLAQRAFANARKGEPTDFNLRPGH